MDYVSPDGMDLTFNFVGKTQTFELGNQWEVPAGDQVVVGTISGQHAGGEMIMTYVIDRGDVAPPVVAYTCKF